jgi:hypothetical protein
MALINCPECDKQISDKAKTCPNCGFPIEEMNKPDEILLQFPELPNDLSIGKPLTNWAGNTHFKGVYDSEGNVIEKITPGVAHVMMYDNGIAISGGMFLNPYPVHNSQIISLKQISRTELGSLNNNDVVGRAVIGALIYGPAGAIIGALTAKKQHSQHYLIINYWDVDSKKAQSLIIGGDKMLINTFIKRHEEEITRSKKDSLVNVLPLGEVQITKAEFAKLTYRQKFAVTEYGYLLSPENAETVGKMLGNFQGKDIPLFCEQRGNKVTSLEK